MSKLSFDSVDVLIYDPVAANRTATRAAMYALGFRRTETVSSLETFVEAMQKSPPDIALCEAQGAAEELCATIQQLRQGGAGHNPFIVIIVTAWDKSTAMINRVVSSGADDLLLRPFSTALLGSRIEAHIERRKGFVITTDYVGPDRRKDAVRASDAELFDPPNSLKMKAKDKLPSDVIARRLDSELRAAREKLSSEKLRRDAFQVCILWRLVQEAPLVSGQTSPELAQAADAGQVHRGAQHRHGIPAGGGMVPVGAGGDRRIGAGRGPQRLHASAGSCRAQPAPGLPSRKNGGRPAFRNRRHRRAVTRAQPGRRAGVLTDMLSLCVAHDQALSMRAAWRIYSRSSLARPAHVFVRKPRLIYCSRSTVLLQCDINARHGNLHCPGRDPREETRIIG